MRVRHVLMCASLVLPGSRESGKRAPRVMLSSSCFGISTAIVPNGSEPQPLFDSLAAVLANATVTNAFFFLGCCAFMEASSGPCFGRFFFVDRFHGFFKSNEKGETSGRPHTVLRLQV